MDKIKSYKMLTKNRFLNMVELEACDRNGDSFPYYLATRAEKEEDLKLLTRDDSANGVGIFAVYGEKKDKVVLIRQFRYPLGDYLYELPAGLVERGEDYKEAGKRELSEETGLTFLPVQADESYTRPYFMSAGLSDETCATVFGYASGTPSVKGLEKTEDLTIILADRKECARILKEERAAMSCAYMLMLFLASPEGEPFWFLKEK